LQPAERCDDGVKQKQQHQQAVVVEVQRPVAGTIPGAAGVVQALQQRRELIEILQPADIPLANLDRRPRLHLHPGIMRFHESTRNTEQMYYRWRKSRAEHDWSRPPFLSPND